MSVIKRMSSIFIFFVIFSCNWEDKYVNYSDINYVKSRVYFRDKLFTGIIVDTLVNQISFFKVTNGVPDSILTNYYKTGELMTILPMKDLYVVNGTIRYYYRNGNLSGITEVRDNLREGICISLYENGQIEYIGHYTRDSLNGYYSLFDSLGLKMREGLYRFNKKDSVWIIYDMDQNKEPHHILYKRSVPVFDVTDYILENNIKDSVFNETIISGTDTTTLLIEVSGERLIKVTYSERK